MRAPARARRPCGQAGGGPGAFCYQDLKVSNHRHPAPIWICTPSGAFSNAFEIEGMASKFVPRGHGVRGAATALSGPRHNSAFHRAGSKTIGRITSASKQKYVNVIQLQKGPSRCRRNLLVSFSFGVPESACGPWSRTQLSAASGRWRRLSCNLIESSNVWM